MKSVPCLKRPWTEVEGTVECIIRSWHELAGKYAPDLDDFLLEVFDTWDRVKTSIDDSPMTQAKETASLKLYRPDELTRTVGTVAALCRALADSDGLFFLSNNDAGDVAGKTKKSGRLALKWLQDHHFIALVEPGENGPRKKKRLAARYRWIGPLE